VTPPTIRKILPIGCRLGVLASAVLLASCAGHSGPLPSTDIDESAFRDHVRVLASDDFEGRRAGTRGEEKTVAYLVEQFRKLGLKPGSTAGYLQQVPMVEITAAPDVALSVHKGRSSRELAYGRDAVVWTKRSVPAVQVDASEMVFAGYGIVAPEYAWNDYAGIDVRGKTLVLLANDPGYASKDAAVFRGAAMTDYGRLSYKVEEAARQGAAAVLLIHDADVMGYGWNVIGTTWMRAQLELLTSDGYAKRTAIEGWLQRDAARALFAEAGLDFAALSIAAAHPGFKPVPMGLQLSAVLHNSIRQFNSANVVALLPGVRRSKEYVLYTSHWDHLGSDPSLTGHTIFNGAVDNATGVAGLLALAQSFARTVPATDRSIVFLATTGGEPESLGSTYYVENPLFPLKETAAVIDVDTLLPGGPTRDVTVFGFGNSDLEDTARVQALLQGRDLHAEPSPEQGRYFRADAYPFARRGVPVLYAQGGFDNAARGPSWGHEQSDDYVAHRFAQTGDQYSPDWDVRGALDDLRLYYEVGYRVAHGRHFPRWYAGSEFRGASYHAAQSPGETSPSEKTPE
jgi:Zn-dependent M28 family amino/carboxypeptidase